MIYINDSGADISGNSIIKLTSITVQDNGQYHLNGDQPDSAANFLLAVTGPETVSDGKKGSCTPLAPVFAITYDTADGTPANEESWGPDNGTHKLKKNFGGGQYNVIGADSDSEMAVVMYTGQVIFKGQTSGAISAGGTGTVLIFAGAVGSESSSGDSVTAFSEVAISSGLMVNVRRHGSGWEAFALECNP